MQAPNFTFPDYEVNVIIEFLPPASNIPYDNIAPILHNKSSCFF